MKIIRPPSFVQFFLSLGQGRGGVRIRKVYTRTAVKTPMGGALAGDGMPGKEGRGTCITATAGDSYPRFGGESKVESSFRVRSWLSPSGRFVRLLSPPTFLLLPCARACRNESTCRPIDSRPCPLCCCCSDGMDVLFCQGVAAVCWYLVSFV